jgi:signal transduction histidine kinase
MLTEALQSSVAETQERSALPAGGHIDSDSGPVPGAYASKPPGSGPGADASSRQEIDLKGLIQRAWEELHVARVHFVLLGPPVSAIGERRALLQAWRELLRSAADAALQGTHSPPLVTVELDPSADAVQILIHDSGPPLTYGDAAALELTDADPEPLARDPGATLSYSDPGKLHPVEGTRRGLWLAHRTLTEQGAQLALSTPQLGGTTVRVTLPHSPRSLRTAA